MYDPLGRYETVPFEADGSGRFGEVLLWYGVAAQIGVDIVIREDSGGIEGDQGEPFRNVIAVVPDVFLCRKSCNLICRERWNEDRLVDSFDGSAIDNLRMMLFEGAVRYRFDLVTVEMVCTRRKWIRSRTLVQGGGVRCQIVEQPRNRVVEDVSERPHDALEALLAMEHRRQPQIDLHN